MFFIILDFRSVHIPTCNRLHDSFRFLFKNNDQVPSCKGWTKGYIMPFFCLSEERSINKDFFGFLWLNSMAEFEMKNISFFPFKL